MTIPSEIVKENEELNMINKILERMSLINKNYKFVELLDMLLDLV